MKYFRINEFTRCFNKNGARCKECRLMQPANRLPDGVEESLQALVEDVLDPLREKYGKPISVNSGFRCPVHNRAVGGVVNSQHIKGEAVDIHCDDNHKIAEIIEHNGYYDQLIIYPTFVHVSWKRNGGNRRQVLRKV